MRNLTAGILLACLILFVFTSCINTGRSPTVSTDEDGTVITIDPNMDPQMSDTTGSDAPELPSEIFRKSGRLTSNETGKLVLWADWEAVSYDGKTVQVTVRPGITCWQIHVGARNTATITVNGQKKTYSTAPIDYDLREERNFPFGEFTFSVELNGTAPSLLEIEVTWPFNGTYSGQKIDILRAAITVELPVNSMP